ncbi:hypothetical protein HU200_044702 [Digitaria exilis]|uniref:Uncharacterized protein n=1 Tax=Digitaria exilis TaxID=1010633 RepID=A0A835B935_9POAL|nr:hypothetical protein HU200_044702 [Digitaria exilis]
MATKASTLLRAARKASLASRAAAAAASRAARAADVAADAARASRLNSLDTKSSSDPPSFSMDACDYDHLPEDSKIPTAKDLESDKAPFNKDRDYSEMIGRFEIFRYNAEDVYKWNTDVPADPKKAAIYLKKRREFKLRLSKGLDVSHFDECYRPAILGPLSDGGDPFLRDCNYCLLKELEKRHGPKGVTVDQCP